MTLGRPEILDPVARRCIATGAALMLAGVILGAFGTHLLEARLPARQFASFQTGVLYQLLHAIGLMLIGVVAQAWGLTPRLRWSARLMLVGIVCFSGSIYLMTAGAPKWLGMVAPIGGLSFMAAWVLLALDALQRPAAKPSP
jgi:uncharacterized membrane protein YgdD (TMEM256/DUF423 family)